MTSREERFEKMLSAIEENYRNTVRKMEEQKAAGKTKSPTYRQLFANKMLYQEMLSLYKIYGLTEEPGREEIGEK